MTTGLLNHGIGAQQHSLRNGEAKRLSCFEVDGQSYLVERFHRQISWAGSGQNPVNVSRRQTTSFVVVDTIANQSTSCNEPLLCEDGR